ncbi:sensor histidine kinase [Halorientalis halophila]|uniref:sensor histidine kinase n=1 Tax=Halorientalis halophila TaxID=3108499 RepID=UPI003008A16A
MTGGETGRRRQVALGVASLVAVSLLLLLANAVLIATSTQSETTRLIWLLAPATVVILLIAVWLWVRSDRDRAQHLTRVAAWAYLGAVALGAGGALNGHLNAVEGIAAGTGIELFVGWAAGGLLDGGLLGIYDAERRLERQRTERAREESEQLAAGLSVINRVLRHDLRNHATVLEGQAELLENADPEEAAVIHHHVDRIVELAEQARQMEAVLRSDDRTVLDAVAVVERVTDDQFDRYPDAAISVESPAEAPVSVATMFDVAVENLVENAVVHNDGTDPTVDVSVTAGDDCVSVAVSDDGPGIPDHELEVRDLPHESALEHSNGLGLWLVDWVVERSDGELDIETGPDGSRVRLTIPRA